METSLLTPTATPSTDLRQEASGEQALPWWDLRDHRGIQEHREHRVPKEHKDRKGLKGLKVHREMIPTRF